jgi:hypothetical protein
LSYGPDERVPITFALAVHHPVGLEFELACEILREIGVSDLPNSLNGSARSPLRRTRLRSRLEKADAVVSSLHRVRRAGQLPIPPQSP